MRLLLYKILRFFIKNTAGKKIVGKKYKFFDRILYYEVSQHLHFYFQNQIKYEYHIQNKLKNYIKPGDLIFDIGSNIGQYSLPFSELTGENGRVIAYEPDYKNFAFLVFNLNINKSSNVSTINKGFGEKKEMKYFFRDIETGGRTSSFDNISSNRSTQKDYVKVTTLDDEIKEYGVPDFVKIDVEGFETMILRGLTKNVENTIFFIEVRKSTKKEVFNYFNLNGFHCWCIDGEDNIEISSFSQMKNFGNYLFKKV